MTQTRYRCNACGTVFIDKTTKKRPCKCPLCKMIGTIQTLSEYQAEKNKQRAEMAKPNIEQARHVAEKWLKALNEHFTKIKDTIPTKPEKINIGDKLENNAFGMLINYHVRLAGLYSDMNKHRLLNEYLIVLFEIWRNPRLLTLIINMLNASKTLFGG